MNETLITRYIAAWMWHLIAVLFLLRTISFLILDMYIWMIGMAGVVLFAEFMSWKRKHEVEEMEKMENEN